MKAGQSKGPERQSQSSTLHSITIALYLIICHAMKFVPMNNVNKKSNRGKIMCTLILYSVSLPTLRLRLRDTFAFQSVWLMLSDRGSH